MIEAEYSDRSATWSRSSSRAASSFLYRTGLEIEVPDFGYVVFDADTATNFYAIIEPQASYRGLDDISAMDIQRLSPIIRRLINEKPRSSSTRRARPSPGSATCSEPASRTTGS